VFKISVDLLPIKYGFDNRRRVTPMQEKVNYPAYLKYSQQAQTKIISEIVSEIINNKHLILQEHNIHDTANRLDNFETLVNNFDILDRRSGESEEAQIKFSHQRNTKRNHLIGALISEMRNKIRFFEQELNIAREIQLKMVPHNMPAAEGYEFQGYYKPSRYVSGDYYDFFSTKDGKIYFVVADVAGKGLPSSLIVASMQAFLYAGMHNKRPIKNFISELNNYLIEKLILEKFVTFFIGVLDPRHGSIRYINAGHNPPYIIKRNRKIVALNRGGPILGMFENAAYKLGRSTLSSGDFLALFTDGVVEAFNEFEEEFSEERLIDTIIREQTKPLKEVVSSILGELKDFCGERPFMDDLTLLLIKKK